MGHHHALFSVTAVTEWYAVHQQQFRFRSQRLGAADDWRRYRSSFGGRNCGMKTSICRNKALLATGVLALLSFPVFLQGGTDSPAQKSEAAQAQLSRLLAVPLPGHAAAEGSPSFYKADNLYQFMDGGADIYLLYDFRVLMHQDFKAGAAELSADIYDMGKAEDAFGIYAAERSPNYTFLPLGAEGYRNKGALNFFQDRFYVKLTGSGANADALLDQLARTLSARIGGTRTAPALLQKLPLEHRVKHSEQYVRKDPLGQSFLSPAYIVSYAWGGQQGKLAVSPANDVAGAKSRMDQLAAHFKKSGECAPAPELGEAGIRGKNTYEGRMIARTQGRYLILLLNPPENGAAILKAAAVSLR
jgi:hypothetical protein